MFSDDAGFVFRRKTLQAAELGLVTADLVRYLYPQFTPLPMTTTAANTPPSLPPVDDDLRDVTAKLRELVEAGRVDEVIELVVMLLAKTRLDNHRLAKRLQAALRQIHGRRSEKVNVNQLALHALIAAAAQGRDDVDGRFMKKAINAHPLYRKAG